MALARYGEIARKLEDALEDYIQTCTTELITQLPIIKGMSVEDLPSERIEITSENSTAERIGADWTGNWTVDVSITYCYNYKDVTREDAQQRASELFDLFMIPNINGAINDASEVDGFTMYGDGGSGFNKGTGFRFDSVRSTVIDTHTLGMTLTATAYCRPS